MFELREIKVLGKRDRRQNLISVRLGKSERLNFTVSVHSFVGSARKFFIINIWKNSKLIVTTIASRGLKFTTQFL